MTNNSPKLFTIKLEDPLSKKCCTINVTADEMKRLETDNYFASLKLEEARNLDYAKLKSEEDIEEIEALDPEINFNELTCESNDNATADSAFKWAHEATLLLIEEYRIHESNFYNGRISRKKLWEKISGQLNAQGYNVTGPQCQSKFAGMKRTYKNIKDQNNKSGSFAKTWPYFALIDDLLGDKPCVVPVATCSSTGKRVRTNSGCSNDSSCSEQDESFKEETEIIEALDPDINFNESTCGLNENATGDSVFKWSHEAILLLIEEFRIRQSNLYSGKISQKKLWEKISGQLNAQGHYVTGPQCQSKFSGMKRTYKNIKDHNSKFGIFAKTWPYFTLINDLLGDKHFGAPAETCTRRKRVRTNSECSSESSCGEQDVVPSKKNKSSSVDKMLAALAERVKKNEESRERRFDQLLCFKEQKAKEDLELKTRALDLLEKILNSKNKF